jgi:hypothetical protein
MRINPIFSMVMLAAWWAVSPTQVWAGLVFGPSARTQFESYRTSLGDTFIDFNTLALNTNLTNQFSGLGVTFTSNINVNGAPFGPFHVHVSAFSGRANTIVGSPCDGGCTDDGRVGYQILFSSPQRRAGLLRNWNTQTLTQFYNASGALLAQHVNTVGSEFVGFMADGANPATNWVARIQIDTVAPANARQVGYSDDLFFGTAPDTIAPSVPAGLGAASVGASQVNLSWSASTDNVGVTAYKVYRGGSLIATLGNVTIYSDSGLIASSTYGYTVSACDAAGNCSAQGAPVTVGTQAVSTSPIIGNVTQQVAPPPATQIVYTVPTGTMPATAVAVTASGTLGAATIAVELDLGKGLSASFAAASTYNVYVAALVPGRQLGATDNALFMKTANLGWQPLASPIASYLQNVAAGSADQKIVIEIIRDTNISTLIGTEIYVGYGTSDAEMLAASRYRGVYKVQ